MTEQTQNLSLNNVSDNTCQRRRADRGDEDLFREEFRQAKAYFKKLDNKKKSNFNAVSYFGRLFNDSFISYDDKCESIIDRVNDFNKKGNDSVDSKKMEEVSFQKVNVHKINSDSNFEFKRSMLDLDKGYLKVILGNLLLFVPLDNLSNQYGYDYILNLYRQAINIKDISSNIVEKASFLKEGESSELIIKLKPEFLGELSLEITMHDGKLGISILASEEVKKIIENEIGKLKDDLLDANLNVDKLVILSHDDQRKHGGNYRHFKHFLGEDKEDYHDIRDNIWFLPYNDGDSVVNYIV